MDENSYLNPTSLGEQCDRATKRLNRDNNAISTVEMYFQSFIENNLLESEAYTALKLQMADYKLVLHSMKSANDYDIYDFDRLKNSIGNNTLIGREIIGLKNSSYSNYLYYLDKANQFSNNLNDADWELERWYYSYESSFYESMADNSYNIYKKCLEKEEEYNQIESNTATLFVDSSKLKSYINTALVELPFSFCNGNYHYNANATWRQNLKQANMDILMSFNSDGTVSPNWDTLTKVMSKSAENITEEEYQLLALAYLNMSNDDMAKFFGLCMNGKNVDIPWLKENICMAMGMAYEDHSEWSVDNKKVDGIIKQISLMSDKSLLIMKNADPKSEIYSTLSGQRNQMVQRLTLINVIKELGNYNGDYKGEGPAISINSLTDRSLEIRYKEMRNVGSVANPIFSYLGDSTVTISDTCNGNTNIQNSINSSEAEFYARFGDLNLGEDTTKFVTGEIKGELLDDGTEKLESYVAKKSTNKALGKAIGFIPLVGDIADFGIDCVTSNEEAKQNNDFIKGQFDSLQVSLIYSEFDCSTNTVKYDTGDKKNPSVYSYEGQYTQKIIDRVNSKLSTDIDIKDVIKDPNKVFKKKNELFAQDPDNDDLYNSAIKFIGNDN